MRVRPALIIAGGLSLLLLLPVVVIVALAADGRGAYVVDWRRRTLSLLDFADVGNMGSCLGVSVHNLIAEDEADQASPTLPL